MSKPKVRIIHNLARSGATLICKCLGCMSDVVLLSEIHPDWVENFYNKTNPPMPNPLLQALHWHNIITPEDIIGKKFNTIEAVKLIERKCAYKDKKLVIRDLSHLDFMGFPIVKPPSFKFLLAEILSDDFEVIRFALVRHPIDQWLSMTKALPPLVSVPLDAYLNGYLEYSKYIQKIGFIRYEDFTKDPEKQMQIICDKLQLQVDRNFLVQWLNYSKITGDTDVTTSRGAGLDKIISLPRAPVEDDLLKQFRSNKKYREAIRLLGYSDE